MMPGWTLEIVAVKTSNGEVVADAADMASALNEHWQQIFESKATDGNLRRQCLDKIRGKLKVTKETLTPTRALVEHAIRHA